MANVTASRSLVIPPVPGGYTVVVTPAWGGLAVTIGNATGAGSHTTLPNVPQSTTKPKAP